MTSKANNKKQPLRRHLFLIGFMGSGKSAVSRALAKKLGVRRYEMDREIEHKESMRISEIFDKYGEEHFRDIETSFVKKLAARKPAVVSCGGGVVLRSENVASMKEQGEIILLDASPGTILSRVSHSTNRPILNGHMNLEYITELMDRRREHYEKAADLTVMTDGKNIDAIAEEIIALLLPADNEK